MDADEAWLTDKNHLAKELLKVCQKMNSERDVSALLDLIATEATKLMGADRASLFLLDRESGQLWSKVALGSNEILRFDARAGIAGTVALTGETINAEDAHEDPRFYKEIDLRTGYRTRSLLAVPLRTHEGEIIGTFEVLNKRSGYFGKADEEILKALAAQAAIAIETAQLVDAMRHHRHQLQEENAQLRKEVERRFSIQSIIGASDKVQAVLRLIDQVSASSYSVLITGESGTGKELAARAIHYKSLRARRPFVAVNCAALPETLVESELFGIEKGVATGVDRRLGKFEAADGGTLFLGEVADLSLTSQAKLLRVLQERVVERVGSTKPIPVDARILAATNKNLVVEIENARFRDDLYYRLKGIHVQMPALREIRQDIPLIGNYYLANYCREMKKEPMTLDAQAAVACMNYRWPGNVRELENEMKRLVLSVSGKTVAREELSEPIRNSGTEAAASLSKPRLLKSIVSDLERRMIQEALQQTNQNQLHAAKVLGLSRQGLIKKMRRYKILLRGS
jgi:Nif-specific regulatory protein